MSRCALEAWSPTAQPASGGRKQPETGAGRNLAGFSLPARICAAKMKWPQVRGHSDASCLAENALVLKGFFVALQAEIVVPRRGKLLVLFLQIEKGDIVAPNYGA
jgi:hypothetical protein